MAHNSPRELLDWRLKIALNYCVLYKGAGHIERMERMTNW